MKASDFPSVDAMMVDPRFNPLLRVTQAEIDHVNDLLSSIRHKGKQILKEAMEVGDYFIDFRARFKGEVKWSMWLKDKFPKLHITTLYRYEHLARNREYIESLMNDIFIPSVTEASTLVAQANRMAKPRVRAVVVREDAEPVVLLEAKLKNYVISLWMLRYLQTEIEGMLLALALKPDQILRILHYVCKEHHEVEEEVLKTFAPKLKLLPKGA